MPKELILTVTLRPETKGYSVLCTELDVASQGETVEESLKNIKEAIELYLETAENIGELDAVLARLGLTRADLKKAVIVPRIMTASVPVVLSV